MRILYLITRANMGGAQVHLLDLIRGLKTNVDPVVGVGETGYLTEQLSRMRVPYEVLPNLVHPMSPLDDTRALFQTARLIRAVSPDLVHTHTSKAGTIGRLAARATGVSSVFTAHTWCFAEGTSWKWRAMGVPAERIAGWCGDAIINVSEANRQLALDNGIAGEHRQVTVWNGIQDTPHRAMPDAAGEPTIVMVARCVPQKNHALLLRAFAHANRPGRILFIGDGPLETSLRNLADGLGISGKVDFLGQRHDIETLLSEAQIFALTTNWEGFPLSILEAMRAGLPVIANDVGGIREAVRHGENGFLIPPRDDEMFTACLTRLLDSPALRRSLGRAARRDYEEKFTLETMVHKTLAIYRSVTGNRVTAPRSTRSVGLNRPSPTNLQNL